MIMKTGTIKIILFIVLVTGLASCEDFVQVAPSDQTLVKAKVFDDDSTANAAVLDIYYLMRSSPGFANGDINSFSFIGALSSGELTNYKTTNIEMFRQFSEYTLAPDNIQLAVLWSEPYRYIFKANAVLEGLKDSKHVSAVVKNRLSGEAKFFRAFSHFYLLNLFGDVPLILTTDYRITSVAPRVSTKDVYEQIVADLQDAIMLLPEYYSLSGGERIRVNKWAAAAMLARVYLYQGDWGDASRTSSLVLGNYDLYNLESELDHVFLANSEEAIWQLLTTTPEADTREGILFNPSANPPVILSAQLLQTFEEGDRRKEAWIIPVFSGDLTLYYPYKYKERVATTPPKEYSMVLRLAEQYLIRAEANAYLGKVQESLSDINDLRQRAGLLPIDVSRLNQADVLLIIEHERQVEFFTEWGHRWLDLKRTGRINTILGNQPDWQPTDSLYPIPSNQINTDPNMKNAQNPGY
jgi:hypothetical protein